MSENQKKLTEVFKRIQEKRLIESDFKELEVSPFPYNGPKVYVPEELVRAPMPELDVSAALEALDEKMQAQDRRVRAKHTLVAVEAPTKEEMLEIIRKRLEFVNRYGAGFGPLPLPLTMRLVYNGITDRQFTASKATEFVFAAFDCAQQLLDDYEIRDEPESIQLQVFRPAWKNPKDSSELGGRKGQWIRVMEFRVQEETPFFSFEELELAHMEMWQQIQWYGERTINPCGETPCGLHTLGTFLPKQ